MPNALRRHFLLKDDIIFLNHGSFGACPRPVFEKYQQWQRELEYQPVKFLGRRFGSLMQASRRKTAAYLGTSAANIVFVPNTTTGLNIVARSLTLSPGDEILTATHEYGALIRTWNNVCRWTGASFIQRPITLPVSDPDKLVDEIWAGVTDRTRVLFLSHITSATALRLPVEQLIERARERKIITIIDGAHVPGQIDLHLDSLGADFYAGNCHKWMMTPKGSAILFARPEMQHIIEPLITSWGNASCEDSHFIQELEFSGTTDIASYLAVPDAIDFMEEHDWKTVRSQCHQLVLYGREQLIAVTGRPPISDGSDTWLGQMIAQPLPALDGERLKSELYDRFKIEIPINPFDDGFLIRISVQGYNTKAEIDALIEALKTLLPELC